MRYLLVLMTLSLVVPVVAQEEDTDTLSTEESPAEVEKKSNDPFDINVYWHGHGSHAYSA